MVGFQDDCWFDSNPANLTSLKGIKIETKKLYRVKLKGLSNSTGVNLQNSFVVANSLTEAYAKVRAWLDEHDYGFKDDRALDSIELLAEDYEFSEVRTRLFL